MGNVLERNHIKASALNHSLPFGLYKKIIRRKYKKNKSFSKSDEGKVIDLENNNDIDETNSWTTTIGTRSVFSVSFPTGERGRDGDSENTITQDDCILSRSNCSGRSSATSYSVSNTSADFSSFENLSEISEHTMMRPRLDDMEWLSEVRQYHDREPVFRKKPLKAALKIRSRRIVPQLKWYRRYHHWAIRQSPKPYKGRDVLNPYIDKALEEKNVDLNVSDLQRGIFYLKCTNC
ncbi:Uncharacterized protein BM_BM10353 [Brugia malayi]|uniref:Bm10353 n=2 Tax=Brugia TaxID=6278 RepID=A0A0J9XYF1_BRUMA|nr:Uncharacterized protein BM_BM10353 [Brugia malayi]CDP97727.1 Bm10353 [Brugia malayi]VIO88384.1 Uncharacterized protein BM_BM10353 [Brugia malayi]